MELATSGRSLSRIVGIFVLPASFPRCSAVDAGHDKQEEDDDCCQDDEDNESGLTEFDEELKVGEVSWVERMGVASSGWGWGVVSAAPRVGVGAAGGAVGARWRIIAGTSAQVKGSYSTVSSIMVFFAGTGYIFLLQKSTDKVH